MRLPVRSKFTCPYRHPTGDACLSHDTKEPSMVNRDKRCGDVELEPGATAPSRGSVTYFARLLAVLKELLPWIDFHYCPLGGPEEAPPCSAATINRAATADFAKNVRQYDWSPCSCSPVLFGVLPVFPQYYDLSFLKRHRVPVLESAAAG